MTQSPDIPRDAEAAPPAGYVAVVARNAEARATTACLLRSAGFRVRSYTTGEALLREPAASEVDAVILHARSPGPDELGTLRDLRRSADAPAALFVVDQATGADAVAAVHSGAFGLIEAPYPPRQLVTALRAAVSARAA